MKRITALIMLVLTCMFTNGCSYITDEGMSDVSLESLLIRDDNIISNNEYSGSEVDIHLLFDNVEKEKTDGFTEGILSEKSSENSDDNLPLGEADTETDESIAIQAFAPTAEITGSSDTSRLAENSCEDQYVWIPKSGSKYHSDINCSKMKNPTNVTVLEAESLGYTPCKKCF